MNFYSAFESELGDVVPIVHTTIGGTRIVGRLTAGQLFFSSHPPDGPRSLGSFTHLIQPLPFPLITALSAFHHLPL